MEKHTAIARSLVFSKVLSIRVGISSAVRYGSTNPWEPFDTLPMLPSVRYRYGSFLVHEYLCLAWSKVKFVIKELAIWAMIISIRVERFRLVWKTFILEWRRNDFRLKTLSKNVIDMNHGCSLLNDTVKLIKLLIVAMRKVAHENKWRTLKEKDATKYLL